MPRFEVAKDDYCYSTSYDGLKSYVLEVQYHVQTVIDKSGTIKVGLGTEFDNKLFIL